MAKVTAIVKPKARQPQPDRTNEVRRYLEEMGLEALEGADLDEWDSEDLEALREVLGDERYQALLDELAEGGAHER